MTSNPMQHLGPWLEEVWARLELWLQAEWAWLLSQRWDGLNLVLAYIAAQTVLILLLVGYALGLRVVRAAQQRRRNRLHTVWHYLVPAFLFGELDQSHLSHSIRRRDFPLFAQFLRPYLLDLAGKDAQQLSAFLADVGLHDFLVQQLRSSRASRRGSAVHCLGLTSDPHSIPLLRKALEDPADAVVYQAAEALMRLQDQESIGAVLRRVSRISDANRERISLYLMQFGIEIVPALLPMVRAPETPPWLTVLVLEVVAHHRYMEATWDVLERYTHASNREVRIACAKTLVSLGEPTLVGLFEEMLGDADPVVCAQGAKALGQVGEPRHAEQLVPLLRSNNFWLLKQVVVALRRIGALERVAHAARRGGGDSFSPRAREVIREELADQQLQMQGPAA